MNKLMMFMLFGFFINTLFLNLNNPLMLGILMMIQTFNLIIMMGKIYYSFWFSYIIFLVLIGGLFILFLYMIMLIYNNKIYYHFSIKIYFMIMILFLLILKPLWYFNNNETEMINLSNNDETLNLLKLYNFPNSYINLLLINYLFFLMIITTKITNFFQGPLKSFYFF